jgi:hypothetical protein
MRAAPTPSTEQASIAAFICKYSLLNSLVARGIFAFCLCACATRLERKREKPARGKSLLLLCVVREFELIHLPKNGRYYSWHRKAY